MPFTRITANIGGSKLRRETLEGRPHLVVEGVILKEGVLNGSGGPIFYPDEENGRDPASWNGRPIVLYHPEENGEFVSANQPVFFETRRMGTIFNTAHVTDDNPRVKPEFWFDEEKTKALDERVYNALVEEKPIEVSTGLGIQIEDKEGEHNGTKYKGVARDYKPDHVAVLPDKVGALPVSKGGGIYANMEKEPESTRQSLSRSAEYALKVVGGSLVNNALSFSDISRQLNDLLASKYGEPGKYWRGYLCEVFPDYCVFENGGELYKIGYTATDKGVSLSGDATKVVRTTDYIVVNSQPKETKTMFDKKAHVTALINNGQIEEKDRATYEALDEAVLKGIKVVAPKEKEVIKEVPVTANTLTVNSTNVEDWKKNAPPEVVAVFNQGEKALKQTKARYVETIKANPNNKFTDAQLAGMDLDTLAATAELAKGTVVANEQSQFLNGWQPDYAAGLGYAPPQPVTANAELEPPPEETELTFDNPMARK
jgi:hypothetical protein